MSQAKIISDAVRQLEGQVTELTEQRDIAIAALAQANEALAVERAENLNLRKVINRANSKADHYMNQHAGLGAGLNHIAAAMVDLIGRHRAHAYTDGVVADTRPVAQVQQIRKVIG